MRVLVACEESQEVCKAFRELGHEAYSADIQECSGGHPEWHILGDVLSVINGNCTFFTQGGSWIHVDGKWDLVIAHPPCTDLAVSGARHFKAKQEDFRQQKACVFFMQMMLCDADHVAVENPVCIMSSCYRKPDCIINPYEFGHPYAKKTCLWLKNLPKLHPTQIVEPERIHSKGKSGGYSGALWYVKDENGKILSYKDPRTAKARSKTFPGIAKAMAEQWSRYIEQIYRKEESYEPIADNDALYGYLCGWCNHPIHNDQNYCDECGKKVKRNA